MGMGVFTGKFNFLSVRFSLFAMLFCVLGRFCNIFPLSVIANLRRKKKSSQITCKMQVVLWFAGLRGAIAYALAENMPGENRETYVTGTLTICLMTTVVCGGFTDKILTLFGMKEVEGRSLYDEDEVEEGEEDSLFMTASPRTTEIRKQVYKGIKAFVVKLDERYLRVYFGGKQEFARGRNSLEDVRITGNYELRNVNGDESDDDQSES